MEEVSLNLINNMTHQVSSAPPSFDLQVLKDLRALVGEDADMIVGELIDCFLQDTAELLKKMAIAIAQANLAEIKTAAHSLKSSSASVGAMSLSALARDLEAIASQGNVNQAATKLTQLTTAFEQVRPFLTREIDDPSR